MLSASAAIYYLFFKAVIAALNELLFITNHIEFSYFTVLLSLMYKSVGKAKEIFPKTFVKFYILPPYLRIFLCEYTCYLFTSAKCRGLTRMLKSLLRISLICAFRIFFPLPNGVRRSTFDAGLVAWLQKLAPFQVFINTSVIQNKTLTIYIDLY